MADDDPLIKTLVVDVHNDRDFTSGGSQAAGDLQTVMNGITSESRELGWEVVPATYDQVIRCYSEAHGSLAQQQTRRNSAGPAGPCGA